MTLAEKKKAENISEYIIHMYQTEDLLRAYNFNIEELSQNIVNHIPEEQTAHEELKQWYQEVAAQMKNEGLEKSGHLSHVKEIVDDLSEMHFELLKSDKNYRQVYDQAKIQINQNIQASQGQINDPVQICINGVYGLLLLRIQNKPVSNDQLSAVQKFGDVLSYLSFKYKRRYNNS